MGRLLPLASLSKWASLVLTRRRCIARLALLGNNVEQSSIQCSAFGRLADGGPLGYDFRERGSHHPLLFERNGKVTWWTVSTYAPIRRR